MAGLCGGALKGRAECGLRRGAWEPRDWPRQVSPSPPPPPLPQAFPALQWEGALATGNVVKKLRKRSLYHFEKRWLANIS